MRIACVHVPQFALQCVTRIDPSLRGAAIAVVGAGVDPAAGTVVRIALHSPVVQACSRAAWALGVRIGMTATAARAVSPDLKIVSADAALERDTLRAIADLLLGQSTTVDLGGRVGPAGAHLAMYCEVPGKTRGTSFGDRLVERLDALGLTARIGIADDRFTAWVAASQAVSGAARATDGRASDATLHESVVVSVPRGGSAAFLAPRPLSLLSITPEVQHMLEALGVATLGEFASLPPPSVHLSGPSVRSARPVSPVASTEADFQARARGDSGTSLRPYTPDGPIAEQAVLSDVMSTPAAIALLAERIAARLHGRGRAATRLELQVTPARTLTTHTIRDGKLVDGGEELAEMIGKALADEDISAISKLRVVVTGEALAGEQLAAAATDAATGLANDATTDATTDAALAAIEAAVRATAAHVANVIDPLGVVLSNTGAGAWQLTSPSLRDERRDAHRRTQRGKERRTRARVQQALVQPRLFKTL